MQENFYFIKNSIEIKYSQNLLTIQSKLDKIYLEFNDYLMIIYF